MYDDFDFRTALVFNNFLMHSIAGFAENSLANCVENHAFRQMPDLY